MATGHGLFTPFLFLESALRAREAEALAIGSALPILHGKALDVFDLGEPTVVYEVYHDSLRPTEIYSSRGC